MKDMKHANKLIHVKTSMLGVIYVRQLTIETLCTAYFIACKPNKTIYQVAHRAFKYNWITRLFLKVGIEGKSYEYKYKYKKKKSHPNSIHTSITPRLPHDKVSGTASLEKQIPLPFLRCGPIRNDRRAASPTPLTSANLYKCHFDCWWLCDCS